MHSFGKHSRKMPGLFTLLGNSMARTTSFLLSLSVFTALAQTGCSKDQVYEGLYEGLAARERVIEPDENGNGGNTAHQMSYRQYKVEREMALDNQGAN